VCECYDKMCTCVYCVWVGGGVCFCAMVKIKYEL